MRLLLFMLKYEKVSNKFLGLCLRLYMKVACIILRNLKQKDQDLIILEGNECKVRDSVNTNYYNDYFSLSSYALTDSLNLGKSYYKDSNMLYKGIQLERLLEPKTVMVILNCISYLRTSKAIWERERFEEAVILNSIFKEEHAFEIFCKSKGIPVKRIFPFSSLFRKMYDYVLRKSASVSELKFSKHVIEKDLDCTPADVLLFAFYINHISSVLTIANKLIERGWRVTIITTKKFLNNEKFINITDKIKVEYFENYITEEIVNNIKIKKKEYKNDYNMKKTIISTNYRYHGADIWPMLKNWFDYMFCNQFPLSVGYIDTVERILGVKKPNFVLGIHAYRSVERTFFEVAKRKRIPTMLIHHAVVGETTYTDFSVADRVAVHGEGMKRVLTRHGLAEDKMVVIGNPAWDGMIGQSKTSTKNECMEYLSNLVGVDPNKKLVVFTTQAANPMTKSILKNMIKVIQKNFDMQLLIKLHPAESMDSYDEVLDGGGEDGNSISVIKDVDLFKTLCASDLVITISSTTALEAMILDTPVLIVNFRKGSDPVPYAESGAALRVYNESDLEAGIKKALYDEEIREKLKKARKKFVYDYAYIQDGKATERVVNLIGKMIEESKREKNEI